MRKFILLSIMILFASLCIFAVWDMEWQDGNEFNIIVTNFGIIGHNVSTGSAGGYWPSGYPGENYIFGAGIWFGGLVDYDNDGIKDTLVSVGYNPNSGSSEMCPGDGSDAPEYDNSYEQVYKSTASWPPKNSNGEILFDSMMSYSDIYAHYSDLDSSQHFADENKPLGLDVQLFSYTYPTKLVEDIVYFRLVIKNVRDDNKDIENTYVGICMDNDIGNESGSAANDLLGFIDTMTVNGSLEQLNIGYQFQTEAEGGWAHIPSILSAKLLQTPDATEDVDLYHDGSYIIPAGSPLGMTSFNSFALVADPVNMQERYQVMAGYDHMTFDPANPDNSYEPFPLWGEGTAGYPGQSENEVDGGDKRFILSCGPFDISYSDSVIYTFGICINRTADEIVPNMLALEDLWASRNNITYTLLSPVDNEKIDTSHTFSWDNSASYDSVGISINNRYIGNLSVFCITADNGSYIPQTDSLPDGYYSWQVFGFDSMMFQGRSSNENFILDKQTENCTPTISEFILDTMGDNINMHWEIIDVDDSIFDNTIYFLQTHYANWDTVRVFKGFNDSCSFNFRYLLPAGYYSVVLVSSDGVTADTSAKRWYSFNAPDDYNDTLDHIAGDASAGFYMDIYDSTKTISGTYYIYTSNPYYMEQEVSVYNATMDSLMMRDSIYYPYVYESDMFAGIGIRKTQGSYSAQADSVRVTNDIGIAYPDSELVSQMSTDKVLGGRNIVIEWHTINDTVYPRIYCENYINNTIPYDTMCTVESYYSYCIKNQSGEFTAHADTLSEHIYIGEYHIYRINGRIAPLFSNMDELPDSGEVWTMYNSGNPYMPLEGDTFMFTIDSARSVKASSNNEKNGIFMKNALGREQIEFSISGDEEIDLVIYDITGRQVDAVYSGNVSGIMNLTYDIDMPKGIYFVKDKLSDYNEKIIIMK